jgi:hypothetical protein
VEAVQKVPSSCWLTSTRAAIAERRGRNTATIAVARKLLTLVYYGLRDGEIRALHPRGAEATAPTPRPGARPTAGLTPARRRGRSSD